MTDLDLYRHAGFNKKLRPLVPEQPQPHWSL